MGLIPSQEEEDERLSNAYDETHPDIEEFTFWKTYVKQRGRVDELENARAEKEMSELCGESH